MKTIFTLQHITKNMQHENFKLQYEKKNQHYKRFQHEPTHENQ